MSVQKTVPGFGLFLLSIVMLMPSVLWRCWLGVGKGIRPVKIWLIRCCRGYPLEQSANSLHMVPLMPLPPPHVCFCKIQNGLSFWYRLTWVVPDKPPLQHTLAQRAVTLAQSSKVQPTCLQLVGETLVYRTVTNMLATRWLDVRDDTSVFVALHVCGNWVSCWQPVAASSESYIWHATQCTIVIP